MFAASKTSAVATGSPPPATDPQFNYVTMLLHGDGTNGAQNNTFVDSSSNNFTITRNGTPTQGSFSPYGDLWSNQFSGTTQAFAAQPNSAFLFGTSDFTIELWAYIAGNSALDGGNARRATVFAVGSSINSGITFTIEGDSTTTGTGLSLFRNINTQTGIAVTGTVPQNAWNHIAVCRSGTSLRFFLNGTQMGSTITDSGIWGSSTYTPFVGGNPNNGSYTQYTNGYISNLRVVKGTALYTSNFTPSTTPLTAVSGTSLLTCQSNRFRDNSSNNFAITRTGTPSVQRFSPFDPAAEYSTSVIGGSGYFGGSSAGLTMAANSAFAVGTGDFTIEFWAYWTTVSGTVPGNVSHCVNSGTLGIYVTSSGLQIARYNTGGDLTANTTQVANQWDHYAFVRSSGTGYIFKNGVQVATGAISTNYGQNGFVVGYGAGSSVVGYISNYRFVKGTAVYTAAFTPPTAPLTAITNTSLLLNTVNAGIYDNAMMNDLVTVGNAQISTSVKKYGTGSMAFDLIDDCLVAPSSTNFQYGAGDFTVEFWLYFASLPSLTAIIFDQRTAATQVVPTLYYDTNNLYYFTNGAVRISGAFTTAGAWVHVALCRSAGSTRLFVNGVQLGSTYTDANNYVASPVYVGARWDLQGELNGYIDDLRITKGYARYTANFTPPTAAFPNL